MCLAALPNFTNLIPNFEADLHYVGKKIEDSILLYIQNQVKSNGIKCKLWQLE